MEQQEYKLKKNYSLGDVTLKKGGTIITNKVKANKLIEAGFIPAPKTQPKAEAEG